MKRKRYQDQYDGESSRTAMIYPTVRCAALITTLAEELSLTLACVSHHHETPEVQTMIAIMKCFIGNILLFQQALLVLGAQMAGRKKQKVVHT